MAFMTPYIAPSGVEKPMKSCGFHVSAFAQVNTAHSVSKKKPPDGEAFFT